MAGLDADFSGEAEPGARRDGRLLPQEPDLDAGKDVRGNVEDGVAEHAALLRASRRSA